MPLKNSSFNALLILGFAGSALPVARAQRVDWPPGEEVRLAVEVGPLGATCHDEVPLIGTADLLGNGSYDLLVSDRRLLP